MHGGGPNVQLIRPKALFSKMPTPAIMYKLDVSVILEVMK